MLNIDIEYSSLFSRLFKFMKSEEGFGYTENLFSDISIKNYIEIIRIVDLTFYNLYSILRNIQECS